MAALPLLGNFGRAQRAAGLDINGNPIVPIATAATPVKTPMDPAGFGANPFQGLADALKGFNINPPPQAGQGPYGKVPGPIGYPTTPYAEATKIYPGLEELKGLAGNEIRSQILGEFTPEEENALWDTANRFGVSQGMPGSQLWSNKFLGNRIEEGAKRRQMGVQNYQTLLNELSKMGVDPALAAEIAARNANMAAAPDPEAAANELLRRFAEGLNQLGRVGGGGGGFGGGGGGIWAPPGAVTNPGGGTRASTGPSGFPFVGPNQMPPQGGTKSPAVATTSYDLYGLGNAPTGTTYDPFNDQSTSIYNPYAQQWAELWGGAGTPTSSPVGPGQDFGFGETPVGTYVNPINDTYTNDPFAGSYWNDPAIWGDTADQPIIDPWEAYFDEYGY